MWKKQQDNSLSIVRWILMLWLGFLTDYDRYKKVKILVKSGKNFKTDFHDFFHFSDFWWKQFGFEENL
jgi:hypothetical protein